MDHGLYDALDAPIANITATTAIVPAPGAGRRIVVLGYKLNLDADGEYLWESAGNDLTGTMELVADTPDGAFCSLGIFTCRANEALNLTATTAANGWVRYIIAPY